MNRLGHVMRRRRRRRQLGSRLGLVGRGWRHMAAAVVMAAVV